MHALTPTWWELFINRTDGTLRAKVGRWFFDPEPLEPSEVSAALLGHQSLGIYATSPDGTSRWVCLDSDTPDGQSALASLARSLSPQATLFEPSRRGAHLWLFCPPTEWSQARSVGLALAQQVGLTCEVFPKSAGRSGVRLPLTPHPKTGWIYPAVDPTTGEMLEIDRLNRLRPAPLPQVTLTKRVVVEAKRSFQTPTQSHYRDLYREIEQATSLREYGPERAIGRCPFHDDRVPSLSLLGGFWRCWAGCGEGGLNAFRARIRQQEGR